MLRFERDGEDLYPRLDAAIEARSRRPRRRVRVEIYRQFGYFPTESSEHTAEYVPWFMRHDDQIERYRIPVDEYIRRSLENIDEYEDTRRRLAAGSRSRSSPRASWRPATSTRSSPASVASSTATCATTA